MNLFLHYSPFWLKAFFPDYDWRVKTEEKEIFLTFDDGPIPGVTEYVLDTLERFDARATFFCIGDNVRKHPGIYEKILDGGHSVGNHTYNHLNGWKTSPEAYITNYEKCQVQLGRETTLFRPPYGRIRKSQAGMLPDHVRVVMWDVLSGDFSKSVSPEQCLSKSIQYAREGSIVLFHDSLKAWRNMSYALPGFLEHFTEREFRFSPLPMYSRR